MRQSVYILIFLPILAALLLLTPQGCSKSDSLIVPETGYNWPSNDREYWPTDGWQTAEMEDHNIDPSKMNIAKQFASNDHLMRALLVVKDGYLVVEEYYGDGGIDESTNLWSVTKSYTSALVGLLMDQQVISSTDVLMSELLPDYPEFNDITLHHVLTQRTGLNWQESGPPWVEWIFSEDWVRHALELGQYAPAGTTWKYSSGNSHFLTSLVYYKTGVKPGVLAKEQLFDPMGIAFEPLEELIVYDRWEDYIVPLPQSWRQDTKGIECASFSLYLTAKVLCR